MLLHVDTRMCVVVVRGCSLCLFYCVADSSVGGLIFKTC